MVLAKFFWEPRDLWVGAYWNIKTRDESEPVEWWGTSGKAYRDFVTSNPPRVIRHRELWVWVCLFPTFPILFVFGLSRDVVGKPEQDPQ